MAILNDQVNAVREPLFDTYTAAKSAVLPTRILFFTAPTDATKGPQLTNMTRSGELPAPESMLITGIGISFFATAQADLLAILQSYVFRLVVNGKPQITAPIEFLPGGVGVNTLIQNGYPQTGARLQLGDQFNIQITPGAPFYAELISSTGYTLTDGTLGLVMRVYLDGIHSLPVG